MINIYNKIINRLRRYPYLDLKVAIFDDFIDQLTFHGSLAKNTRLKAELLNLQSVGEKYQFAVDLLNPHQHKIEILSLIRYAMEYEPETICEIGTAGGGTNFLLSQCFNKTKKVAGIDLIMKNQHKLKFYTSNIEHCYIRRDSTCPQTIGQIKNFFANDGIDFLFIDGDHSYEGVKRDFELYSPFVNENGLIIFHDIIPDYKTKLNQDTGRYAGDVPVFWNEVKKNYKHQEFVENKDQDGLGIGLIHWKKDNH
tara:strand:+ start:2416 stop:3174 length:759 start_codon:yes stop_codon:yes gene_type:complete